QRSECFGLQDNVGQSQESTAVAIVLLVWSRHSLPLPLAEMVPSTSTVHKTIAVIQSDSFGLNVIAAAAQLEDSSALLVYAKPTQLVGCFGAGAKSVENALTLCL